MPGMERKQKNLPIPGALWNVQASLLSLIVYILCAASAYWVCLKKKKQQDFQT